jgi:acetyltransferase-like isoleucine patch superfamily enzyme
MKTKLLYFLKNPLQLLIVPITKLPYFSFIRDTQDYQVRVNFETWFFQKVLNLGRNKNAYWPVHFTSTIHDPDKIFVGVDTCPGFSKGCYIQGMGGIYIGDFTRIGPNVVIVSANHDLYDTRIYHKAFVKIGSYCWLGAGAKIMPGVELGDWTIVAAGTVVTKSFKEGYCVIGGVPAKVIKRLDPNQCIPYHVKVEYHGYVKKEKFEKYKQAHLQFQS